MITYGLRISIVALLLCLPRQSWLPMSLAHTPRNRRTEHRFQFGLEDINSKFHPDIF